jgi:hypothetical protein
MSDEFDYTTRVLPVDANVQVEVAKFIAEGWVPVFGATPIAIWHLQRPKNQPAVGAHGGVSIRDDGLFVIKANGELRK